METEHARDVLARHGMPVLDHVRVQGVERAAVAEECDVRVRTRHDVVEHGARALHE